MNMDENSKHHLDLDLHEISRKRVFKKLFVF